jgi:DNA-binding NarL/FixJ family response regulator
LQNTRKLFQEEKLRGIFIFYSEGWIDQIDQKKPDILILDNNLPDGKGWQYVDSIVEKNPHLRFFLSVLIIKKGNGDIERECYDLGKTAFS